MATKVKSAKQIRKRKVLIRNIIIIVIMLVIPAGAIAWNHFSGTGKGDKLKANMDAEDVIRDKMEITVKATGNLEPWEQINLKPEASGKVLELYVDEGDDVVEGQIVALLDQTSQINTLERARSYVAQSKARLDQTKKGYREADKVRIQEQIKLAKIRLNDAERELKRVEELREHGFVSQMEYDSVKTHHNQIMSELDGLKEQYQILLEGGEAEEVAAARAAYDMALADLKEAERMLGDASVKSPMSGRVLQRYVSEGTVILSGMSTFSQGEALMSIGDIDKMKMIARVDEGDIGQIKVGQRVLIEVDAYSDDVFEGFVTKISPMGTAMESLMTTFGVTVEIDNADHMLKPGFTADVEIVIDEITDAILIPFRAVLQTDDKSYCFVVDDEDMIEEREITVDRTNFKHFEVIDGITEGERVVTRGRPNKLSEKNNKKSEE